MKPHFGKQITESPRHGRGWSRGQSDRAERRTRSRPAADAEPGEEFPSQFRMSMGKGGKYFSDKLGPLWRFLLGSVGRPWDEVYAELNAALPVDAMQGIHIRQHLDQFVAREVEMVDGVPVARGAYGRRQLYVHPRTGRLARAPDHGLVRTPDGRWLQLRSWARHHDGKPVEAVRRILALGRRAGGQKVTSAEIDRTLQRIGLIVDGTFIVRTGNDRRSEAARVRREQRAAREAGEAAAIAAMRSRKRKARQEE